MISIHLLTFVWLNFTSFHISKCTTLGHWRINYQTTSLPTLTIPYAFSLMTNRLDVSVLSSLDSHHFLQLPTIHYASLHLPLVYIPHMFPVHEPGHIGMLDLCPEFLHPVQMITQLDHDHVSIHSSTENRVCLKHITNYSNPFANHSLSHCAPISNRSIYLSIKQSNCLLQSDIDRSSFFSIHNVLPGDAVRRGIENYQISTLRTVRKSHEQRWSLKFLTDINTVDKKKKRVEQDSSR